MPESELPTVGAIIFYKMRSSDSPVEPDREWRGRVIRAYPISSRGRETGGHEGRPNTIQFELRFVYIVQ